MRNLKRALSLTLASVMLLGMMVVGSSAAAGYSDVDENDNVEAIEVLQTVQVMVGDDRGFGPDRPVTRNEMAVVMGKLLNLDYNYYSEACPFTDVADWAKGWVGAAAANGIVSGRGNGIYDGEATVTAVEAASMMMRALGYFKYQNDYADGFQVSTVRQGTKIGIFDQVGTDATTAMTRNQVAQMALNALKSGMVEPDGNTINLTTPDGSVFTGKVNYVYVTSNKDFARAISSIRASSMGSQNDSPIVELGEQLYDGKLKLEDGWMDDFGRPSRRWEYDGKAIGTYMKKELIRAEYTDEVTGKMLYDLLGSETIKTYDFDVAIDGVDIDGKTGTTDHNNDVLGKDGTGAANSKEPYFDETYMTKTYKSKIGQTGKGVLTQVFVNGDTKEVDIAVINTYLAKATADYSEKKDEAKFDVYALTHTGSSNNTVYYKYVDACKDNKVANTEPLSISSDDFAIAADVKKDDIFLVTQANGEIKTVAEPQVISGATLNAFSKDSYVVADSTQYDYNTTVDYDPETLNDYTDIGLSQGTEHLKNTEYNIFLDPYGYLIGVEVVDAVKNYIFLTGIDNASSNLRNKTADAAGILLDGTFVEFTMNLTDSEAYLTHGGYKNNASNDGRESGYSYAGGSRTAVGKFTEGPLWNTWCTYTVDKNGTYTLKEVKDLSHVTGTEKAKAGQYHDASYSNKDIDSKHISLKSAAGNNFVYGNNDTVYIVAELESIVSHANIGQKWSIKMPDADTEMKDIVTGNSHKVGIISGVDSVTTGIDNVNLKTWAATDIEGELKQATNGNRAYPGNVYTLFGDDGYVMAAVVVGEDDGVSKNLIYSHKDKIESERYDSANDEHTWTRKVIFNGEEITLTEKGSKVSVLKALKENVWYEITYKADGTVKGAEYVKYTDGEKRVGTGTSYSSPLGGPAMDLAELTGVDSAAADVPGNFVKNIDVLEYAINDGKSDGTTVYEQVWGKGVDSDGTTVNSAARLDEDNAPSLKGNTLYMNTLQKRGFRVKDDVKTVFIQRNNGSKTTEYGANISDLEDILKLLNYSDANDSYCFKISAIIDGSHASVVVIHDWNETGATTSGDHNPDVNTDGYQVDIDAATSEVTLLAKTSDAASELTADPDKAVDIIAASLEAKGWTVDEITWSNDANGDDTTGDAGWVFSVSKTVNGRKMTARYWYIPAAATVGVTVYKNGVEQLVDPTTTVADLVGITGAANKFVLTNAATSGAVTATNATGVVEVTAAATVSAGTNYGTSEFTKYTAGTFTANGVALSASTSVTNGAIYDAGAQKYITVGASVKTILTATAKIEAPGTWATYTTKMAIASDKTGDTVAYDANQSVTGWPAAAQTLTNNTAFTTGTASTLVAEDETFTVTHTGTAASATTFSIGNITVTAPKET